MKIILGIGNPGKNYKYTRHNIGFQMLDLFAEKFNLQFIPSNNDYWYAKSSLETFPFILIKPTTYVNNSGFVVLKLIEKYRISEKDILVIVDDINIRLSELRLRTSGGDGGHNGLKSIINNIKSNNFPRIRIGIANSKTNESLATFVLSNFTNTETKELTKKSSLVIELIKNFIIGGTSQMLNLYSRAKSLKNKEP